MFCHDYIRVWELLCFALLSILHIAAWILEPLRLLRGRTTRAFSLILYWTSKLSASRSLRILWRCARSFKCPPIDGQFNGVVDAQDSTSLIFKRRGSTSITRLNLEWRPLECSKWNFLKMKQHCITCFRCTLWFVTQLYTRCVWGNIELVNSYQRDVAKQKRTLDS